MHTRPVSRSGERGYGQEMLRLLAVVAVVGSGCASAVHAQIARSHSVALAGPKKVTIVGSNDTFVDEFEVALRRHGFTVARQVPRTVTRSPTKYLFEVSGVCSHFGYGEGIDVTGYALDGNQRVAKAVLDHGECPGELFNDFAAYLDRVWVDNEASIKPGDPEVSKAANAAFEQDPQ